MASNDRSLNAPGDVGGKADRDDWELCGWDGSLRASEDRSVGISCLGRSTGRKVGELVDGSAMSLMNSILELDLVVDALHALGLLDSTLKWALIGEEKVN